jgi:hypothetical protein
MFMVTNTCPAKDENETVIRKIDGAFVVWFPNGNQYLRLEEPAFFVFQGCETGLNEDLIARQCAERYQIPENKCRHFVAEIIDGLGAIRQNPVMNTSDGLESNRLQTKTFTPFSIHNYIIGEKCLRFSFETRHYEHYLHPLLQHLETNSHSVKPILFELFGHDGKIILRVNCHVKGIWTENESHLLNGMAFLQIMNVIYGKKDDDWMAIIHGSAVTNGKKTIVFTASPGSGKSTMAALLQQKGFPVVSDDFIPLERITQHVFPFPAAMSVKEEATGLLSDLYPSLLEQGKAQRSRTHKQVRYLPVEGKTLPAPVKEVVFIKYDPAIDFKMEMLSKLEALKILLDETWTSPSPENAGRFLDWYCGITCYRLVYSNNEKAIQTISEMFRK